MNRAEYPVMSEAQTVAMAGLCWVGASLPWFAGALRPLPMAAGVVGVTVGFALGRPWVVVVAVAALALWLGYRSDQDFQPVSAGHMAAEVTLITDPRPFAMGVRCRVRTTDGTRLDASAFGANAAALGGLKAGDRVTVEGSVTPLDKSKWAKSNHLKGRLSISEVRNSRASTGLRRGAEWVRDKVTEGADPVSEHYQPLYLGLVVGDDRFQTEAQKARFRAAGLTHLLAVSGQNVAFVLAVGAPLIRSFGRRTRLVVVISVLVLFAVVTRMEPSVIRATVTAGLATAATLSGHPQSGLRLLALAVSSLLIIDPLLVNSVGFQLSVAASAGILLIGPLISARLPGPSALVEPFSITVAAQLGVLPLLLTYFGPVSLGSIPANLVAGWVAGLIMMWGLTVGVVAGMLPDPIGAIAQLPADLGLWWLDSVAATVPRLALPRFGAIEFLIAACLGGAIWALGGSRRLWGRPRLFLTVPIVVLLVVSVPTPPTEPVGLGGGYWIPSSEDSRNVSVLVVEQGARSELLDEILARRITEVDVMVAESGTRRQASIVRAVHSLVDAEILLAPPQHQVLGATRLTESLHLPVSGGYLEIVPTPKVLQVTYPSELLLLLGLAEVDHPDR